jgi:acyl-CoA thioesterase
MTTGIAQETASRCAEIMWRDDNASRSLGMELLHVQPGRATLRMTVTQVMVNGHGIGHGGCNTYNRRTVARSAAITYLAPTRLGDVLTAEAVERERQERDGTYDVHVLNGEEVVAEFVGRSREIRGSFIDQS